MQPPLYFLSLLFTLTSALPQPEPQEPTPIIPNPCNAAQCLPNALYHTCALSDLNCVCAQPEVETEFVEKVAPCLNKVEGRNCTEGGVWAYKMFVTIACEGVGKRVLWPGLED